MTLYTGCVYNFETGKGIYGVLVTLKTTLWDGKTQDPKMIQWGNYDRHEPLLAPPRDLILDYHKQKINWDEYVNRFHQHMQKKDTRKLLENISEEATEKDIAFLCVESTPEKCHRRLLAEECKKINTRLRIVHI